MLFDEDDNHEIDLAEFAHFVGVGSGGGQNIGGDSKGWAPFLQVRVKEVRGLPEGVSPQTLGKTAIHVEVAVRSDAGGAETSEPYVTELVKWGNRLIGNQVHTPPNPRE